MKRADVKRSGFAVSLALGLVLGAVLAACSAASNKDGSPFGAGGNTTGNGGATGNGGVSIGGNGAGGLIIGNGGTAAGGAGTGGTGISVGGTCPPSIDRGCTDVTQFANATAGPKLLYPYNNTIFPRGLGSPTFQWDTGNPSAMMIEMRSGTFTYRECLGAQAAANVRIPQDAWDAQAACANGETDPVTVTITMVTGGQPRTVSTNLYFARATIKTAIYYNTYDTKMVASSAGAVMKITPGAAQNPTVFLSDPTGIFPTGPCFSCHALSANGGVMIANRHTYVPFGTGVFETHVFDVLAGSPAERTLGTPIKEGGFAGVYPDGSVLMTNGPKNAQVLGTQFPNGAGQPVALEANTSRLIDTSTGAVLVDPANPGTSGWNVLHGNMPMFSPDGKHMVYNDQDQNNAHSLWVIDFDIGTRTFSNKRQIFNDASRYPGWPFFTPDSKQVIFVLGTADNFTSQIPNPVTFIPYGAVANSRLMIVDVATGTATPLGLANGYSAGTTSYLPNNDNDFEFYSTVSPVAAGGYFWAFFTSRRSYGNLYNKGKDDYTQKKLWATAISIGQAPGVDPSHPAFYLEGQELTTGNMRAFAALEPCKEDGSSCTAGSDCCSGYCTQIDANTGIGICGILTVNECAKLDDRCTADADCCTPDKANGAILRCLGGYCAELFQ